MNGFLAPDGIMYECGYYGHSALAQELIEKYGTLRMNPETLNFFYDDESLLFSGFIYFGTSANDSYMFVDNENNFAFTKEQLDWLDLNGKEKLKEHQLKDVEMLKYLIMEESK